MGSLNVDYITDRAQSFSIPVSTLKGRIIQYISEEYTAGEFNPDNTYRWIPGAHYDFTPLRSDTRIKYNCRLPMAWVGAAHSISAMKFFVDTTEYFAWSQSMTYYENSYDFEFEVPSWGAGVQGRIGLQIRSHANNNNEVRVYSTTYWNGAGSRQTANGQMFIEEIYY